MSSLPIGWGLFSGLRVRGHWSGRSKPGTAHPRCLRAAIPGRNRSIRDVLNKIRGFCAVAKLVMLAPSVEKCSAITFSFDSLGPSQCQIPGRRSSSPV